MEDFIVWDAGQKIFKEVTFDDIERGRIFINGYKNKISKKNTFPFIGKKDIKNKKIYANSSLIKVMDEHSRFFDDICKVSYHKGVCAYKLTSIDFEDDSSEFMKFDAIGKYYEIVDTIQENNLGLLR